jgi:hypothetical protein
MHLLYIYSKNTLTLKLIKFIIVDQGLSWLFTGFLTVKILICFQDQKFVELLGRGVYDFSMIHVKWKHFFNLRKKTKNKLFRGYFDIFTRLFV